MIHEHGHGLDPNAVTRDHIVPKSKGGHLTVRVCRSCNEDKRHLSLTEWRCVLMLRRRRVVLYAYERWFLRYIWCIALLDVNLFLASL